MKSFFKYFFGVMDNNDKKGFLKFLIVLILGSIFSILGIGAVLPFMSVIIEPNKIMSYNLFQGYSYHQIVVFLTLLLIIAFAIKNLVALWLVHYQNGFLQNLVAKIQQKLFTKYMASNYEYHLNSSTPEMIRNINNEIVVLNVNVISPLGIFLSEFISLVFVIVLLAFINFAFTILVMVSLVIGISLFMKLIRARQRYYANLRSDAWSATTENVLAGLSGIKEVKLYHCENVFLNRFRKSIKDLKLSTIFQNTFGLAPRMLIEFLGLTVVMVVLCGFVLSGSSPQSMLILLGVFGVAAAQLLPSLNRLTQQLVSIRYGVPALKTIYDEFHKKDDHDLDILEKKNKITSPLEFSSKIELQDLHYSYNDGTKAIFGISLDIFKNKKIAFVGKSGAGKTTLVDLIMGLYEASQGRIRLDGTILSTDQQKLAFQKLFAYIPQSIILFDKTIRENIAFGIDSEKIDNNRVKESLKLAQLDEFVNGLKDKENTFIGESGIRLSGGQRQRIGIARALYRNPQILVMDEATSALDNNTEKEITSVLSKLTNLTIITIAHRLTTIEDYDVIYLLDKGKVVSYGNYQELLQKSEIFRNMVARK